MHERSAIMEKIELAKHIKQGDTFYTPFTSPKGLGDILSLSSWARCWLPEFLWIGLIIRKQGRKKGFENMSYIIEELKAENMGFHNYQRFLNYHQNNKENIGQ